MTDLAEVLRACAVGPTDKLVIVLPHDMPRDEVERFGESVRGFLPEGRLLVIAGAQDVYVVREVDDV